MRSKSLVFSVHRNLHKNCTKKPTSFEAGFVEPERFELSCRQEPSKTSTCLVALKAATAYWFFQMVIYLLTWIGKQIQPESMPKLWRQVDRTRRTKANLISD